jgi:hypothetical protein
MDMCHKKNHLVARVLAYAPCCMNMDGWKIETYWMYIICITCHMQLDVTCNLSYATKPKINCMCCMQLKIVTYDSCKMLVLF